jgi:DNA helicase-2/ATP-dependent DNA helicase PcrA
MRLRDAQLDRMPAELFEPGARIRHFAFGPGTIIRLDEERGAYLVQFDSIDTPRSISLRAKLDGGD